MLYVYPRHEGLGTELLSAVLHDEAGVDHVGLVVPPVERAQVVGVLFLVDPAHVVLVYHLPCFFIGEGAVSAILGVVFVLRGFVVPVGLYEWRGVYPDGGFCSHDFNFNITITNLN